MASLSLAEFKKKLHPCVRVLSYTSVWTPCIWECKKCGKQYEYKTAAEVYRRKVPCECERIKEMQSRIPAEKHVEVLTARPFSWKCTDCGKACSTSIARIAKTARPCNCRGSVMATSLSEVKKQLKEAGRRFRLHNYRAMGGDCEVECLYCGNTFTSRPVDVISGACLCPTCHQEKRLAHEHSKYVKRLRKNLPNIKVLGKYLSHSTPIEHLCRKCGTRWLAQPSRLQKEEVKFGCPTCAKEYCQQVARSSTRFVKHSIRYLGRRVKVQGYEDFALRHLEKKLRFPRALKIEKGKPVIQYKFSGRHAHYFPDFYYPPENKIYEVKSTWTFIDAFEKNAAKAQASIRLGYKFSLLLVLASKNAFTVLHMYRGWYEDDFDTVLSWIRKSAPEKYLQGIDTLIKGRNRRIASK